MSSLRETFERLPQIYSKGLKEFRVQDNVFEVHGLTQKDKEEKLRLLATNGKEVHVDSLDFIINAHFIPNGETDPNKLTDTQRAINGIQFRRNLPQILLEMKKVLTELGDNGCIIYNSNESFGRMIVNHLGFNRGEELNLYFLGIKEYVANLEKLCQKYFKTQ